MNVDSAILAELQRIGDAVERLVELQQALLVALMEDEDAPQVDLDGNPQPRDRDEGEEL